MAKTETQSKAKEKDETVTAPDARDGPGLSPLERMTDLTRRIVNVPKDEAERLKKQRRH